MAFRIAVAVGITMVALNASVRSQDLDFGPEAYPAQPCQAGGRGRLGLAMDEERIQAIVEYLRQIQGK